LTDESNSRAAVSRTEWLAVLLCSVAASLAAVAWSWRNGALLNWGDAVAHMHIARRVLDCHQPRLSQLGSVWLPLPHILLLPFVQVYSWWANGIAGIIPSALAYVAACAGIYRLARRWLQPAAAALTLAFFAINPNLLYLQTTAMTEPLFVCEMIWIVVWLVEWRTCLDEDAHRVEQLLGWIAAALVAAILTRYDGWVMALLAWSCIGLVLLKRGQLRSRTFWLASAVVVAAPIAWFIYNAATFGDWLEFARGPYSAKAIELRTASHGAGPPHPGWHDPWVGLLFFLKVSEMDATAVACGNCMLALSVLGTAWAWMIARRRAFTWALLLWLPVPFYAYSVAYSSVPIFLPVWWPHSWYNTRYGMELLPALALGLGFVADFSIGAVREFKPQLAKYAVGVLVALVALNAWKVVREGPLVYVEGTKNMAAHRPYQVAIPPVLRAMLDQRPGAAILMETSVDPEIVALTGIRLRQTINEADLEIWGTALKAPAAHAGIVLAFDGDAVDSAVKAHPEGLRAVRRFTANGQPSGTLYVADNPGSWPVPQIGTNRDSR
jgi:4-amino-4-deoxy-L-arabinose transferase-like glycosyltransferase